MNKTPKKFVATGDHLHSRSKSIGSGSQALYLGQSLTANDLRRSSVAAMGQAQPQGVAAPTQRSTESQERPHRIQKEDEPLSAEYQRSGSIVLVRGEDDAALSKGQAAERTVELRGPNTNRNLDSSNGEAGHASQR